MKSIHSLMIAFTFLTIHVAFINNASASIAATVNNQVITQNELVQRQKLLSLTGGKSGSALNELIDEKIKLSAAKKNSISVSEADVERSYALMAERANLSVAQLTNTLNERGIEASTLKNRLRAELTWHQLVQMQYARTTPPVPSESETLSNFVLIRPNDNRGVAEYTIARVVIASSDNNKSEAMRKANALRSSISSCNGLKEKFSKNADIVVFNPSIKSSRELPEVVVNALNKTAIGKATPAYEGQNGVEIGVVCAKRIIGGSNIVARDSGLKAENMEKKLQEVAATYLKELKQEAIIDMKK